jgi:hypothetical protein
MAHSLHVKNTFADFEKFFLEHYPPSVCILYIAELVLVQHHLFAAEQLINSVRTTVPYYRQGMSHSPHKRQSIYIFLLALLIRPVKLSDNPF